MPDTCLFERIGGKPAVNLAVDIFYKKVLADEKLIPFFKDTDMQKQIGKQKLFLTYAFGGLPNYTGRNMRDAHAKAREKGLNENHFNRVATHLQKTLEELKVPQALINEAMAIAGSTKKDVLDL